LRIHDVGAGAVVAFVSLIAMVFPTQKTNLCNLVVAAWLVGVAFALSRPLSSPTAQSEALSGLLLLMFAIIPTDTMEVPLAWKRFFDRNPDAVDAERAQVARRPGQGRRILAGTPPWQASSSRS
jgi:hypothetical protein